MPPGARGTSRLGIVRAGSPLTDAATPQISSQQEEARMLINVAANRVYIPVGWRPSPNAMGGGGQADPLWALHCIQRQ